MEMSNALSAISGVFFFFFCNHVLYAEEYIPHLVPSARSIIKRRYLVYMPSHATQLSNSKKVMMEDTEVNDECMFLYFVNWNYYYVVKEMKDPIKCLFLLSNSLLQQFSPSWFEIKYYVPTLIELKTKCRMVLGTNEQYSW